MRNLKKFLALVLAMMMIFSLMVSVNAAADYTDRNQVSDTYQEAVDVTDALGIFRGRDGNTFQPQSNVRRDEFATVLYRLATGDVHDEHLNDWRGIVSFADIPADNWAAPYVAYAYSAGLMQGDGTNFHPTLPINGYDAALTLLRLLGYGKKGEYTGSYQLNVAIDGARIGLTNVVGTRNLSGNATREIIAELAYDALNCDMVYFDPAGGIYQNDNRWDNAKLGAVIFDMEVIRHGDYKNPNNHAYGTWDLMRDFQLTPDVFFRPDPVYVVLMKDQVIYEGRPTPIATYNGNFTEKDAQPYITAYNTLRANVTLYYNGVQVANPMTDTANTTRPTFTKSTASNLGLWIDEATGIPGYEIEIYDITTKDDSITQYRVVVREATLAEVDETDENTGDIDLILCYYSPVPGAAVTEDTTSASYATWSIPKTADTYAALAAHEEGDLVAVYLKNGAYNAATKVSPVPATELLEVAELQEVKTTINHIDRNTWKYTATNGTVYQRTRDTFLTSGNSIINSYGTTGDTYLYLLNGYILYRAPDDAAATTGYAYLADVREDNQGWEIEDGGKIYIARLYLSDRTVVEVKATDYKGSASPYIAPTSVLASFSGNTPKRGELVWYSVGPNGVYTIKGIASSPVTSASDIEITKGKAEGKTYTTTGFSAVVYDSKTVFFVVNTNPATGAVISVDPYVGIANVPNVSASGSNPTTVVAAAKSYGGGTATGVEAVTNGRVTAVMIMNPISSTVNNYFIIGNSNAERITEGTGSNKVEYYVYNAVVGGKITTVKVGAGINQPANPNGLSDQVYFYSSVVERNGIITSFENDLANGTSGTPSRGVYYIATSAINKVSNTVIKIGSDPVPGSVNGNYVSASLKAYIYDTTKGTVRSVDLSKVDGNYKQVFMVVDSSSGINVLTELYLVPDPT